MIAVELKVSMIEAIGTKEPVRSLKNSIEVDKRKGRRREQQDGM